MHFKACGVAVVIFSLRVSRYPVLLGLITEIRMRDEICLVLTTCPDENSAERLAEVLVEQRLAACVSAGSPAVSTYPWKGKVERESEIPLTIKTVRNRVSRLTETLVAHHPYEVPEVLVLPVAEGLDAYMDWIRNWLK